MSLIKFIIYGYFLWFLMIFAVFFFADKGRVDQFCKMSYSTNLERLIFRPPCYLLEKP